MTGEPQKAPREPQGPLAALGWDNRATALAVVLVLLTAAAFGSCLGNEFVLWDDDKNFDENPSYRGLGWAQLLWDWTSFHVGVYQPLAWMLLGAEYLVFGLRPWGYHLTSLLLYALNSVVLFELTMTLLRRCRPEPEPRSAAGRSLALGAALAVALFAIHPLRTEVVAWASCQPYLPCALFSMLTVLAYLHAFPETEGGPVRQPRRGWLLGSFGLFVAALLSKAVAVTLPAVLLILDVYPLGRLGGASGRWFGPAVRRVWWEKLPFAALSLAFAGLAIVGRLHARHLVDVRNRGLASRVAQACYGVWFYLVKTVLPTDLTAYYPLPARITWSAPVFLLSILATLGVSVGLFLLRRRHPGLLAAWLSYLVILAPNSGLMTVGDQIVADRYSYAALMGPVVLLAAGLRWLSAAARRAWPAGACLGAASLGVLAGLIVLSRAQCQTWQTSERLWTHALSRGADRSAVAHYNLGLVRYRQGRLEEAGEQYDQALRLDPKLADAHNNLGALRFRQGRLEDALAEYDRALRLNPNLADAHSNLGLVRYRQGRLEDALAEYDRALRLNPNLADAHNNLGRMRYRQGRLEEALAEYVQALRLNPNLADAHNNLGLALSSQGRLAEGTAQFAEAVRLDPDLADAHNNLGVALFRQGQVAEAMTEFATTMRLDPNNAQVHYNCARIWTAFPEPRYRDGPRAVAAATRACELTAWKDASYLETLAAACAEAGDLAGAVNWQARSVDLLTDEKARAESRARLEAYRLRQGEPRPIGAQ
jgi:tetratricopeptide (TPR) repeat protein